MEGERYDRKYGRNHGRGGSLRIESLKVLSFPFVDGTTVVPARKVTDHVSVSLASPEATGGAQTTALWFKVYLKTDRFRYYFKH